MDSIKLDVVETLEEEMTIEQFKEWAGEALDGSIKAMRERMRTEIERDKYIIMQKAKHKKLNAMKVQVRNGDNSRES